MLDQPFLILRQFSDFLDLKFLTRHDNVSTDKEIAACANIDSIASLHQMHGNHAIRVQSPSSRTLEADGLATDTPGLSLVIRFADCQNLVIVNPTKQVIALVHAGWKGMRSKIISSTYDLLSREWGIKPKDTWVGLGPSLCTKCAEFTDPLNETPELKGFIVGRSINLQAASDHELDLIGIPKSQRERSSDCTRCQPEKYWTYRGGDREKVSVGYTNCFAATIKGRKGK